jgi:hypothetical protein
MERMGNKHDVKALSRCSWGVQGLLLLYIYVGNSLSLMELNPS